ncbi:trehalose-phosphatase [Palleronia sediminis]|uniref:Trehalose 6-phosphate phosphatase n=1 Tax=Palleronia sediminis TaxID=2547833 RepID=A0A4V3B986_9RHOB|nr:trehalose-phosphatase [Palleronia sediminis]
MNFYELIGFSEEMPEPDPGKPRLPPPGDACVFLDMDGTLVDIADRPDGIAISPDLGALLDDLLDRTDGRTAIVSGRDTATLKGFLPGFRGVMVGSHGAERRGGGLPDVTSELPSDFGCIRKVLRTYADHRDGVLYEEKPYSAALHFRQAPDAMPGVERFLEAFVADWEGLTLHRAKMALEIMLSDVSKGRAVADLHSLWGDGTTPIAIGDDRTDEGMLRYAVERGGIGVKVGDGPTAASCRLSTPREVRALLRDWLDDGGHRP